MINKFLTALLLLFYLPVFAQIEFSRALSGESITHINEGQNFDILLGYKSSNSLYTADHGMIRLSAIGQFNFNQKFLDSDSTYFLEPHVCSDPLGNSYVTCKKFGGQKRSLIKLDPTGNILWQKNLSVGSMQYGLESRMLADTGALYVCGQYLTNNTSALYFQKFSHQGQLIVSKRITPAISFINSTYTATEPRIIQLPDSDLLVFFQHFNASDNQIFFLSRITTSGTVVWSETIDISNEMIDVDALVLSNGNIICLGAKVTNWATPNKQSIVLMKFSATGNLLQHKNFESSVLNAGLEPKAMKIEGDTIAVIGTFWPTPYSNFPRPFYCKLDTSFTVLELEISQDTGAVLCASRFEDKTIVSATRFVSNGTQSIVLERFGDHTAACGANFGSASWQNISITPQVLNVNSSANIGSVDTLSNPATSLVSSIGAASCANCVLPLAGFNFTGSNIIEFNNTSTLPANFTWHFGDGSTSNQTDPSHTYANAGIYSVTLTVSNGCGIDSSVQQVSFNPQPIASFNYLTANQGIEFYNTSLFIDSSLISWDFGDGSQSSDVNATHVFSTSGNYNVCLSVGNSIGTDSVCESISISCLSPFTPFSYSETNSDSILFVNENAFIDSLQWSIDGVYFNDEPTFEFRFDDTLNHEVCLELWHFCGVDSLCQSIAGICSEPIVNFDYSILNDSFYFTPQLENVDSLWWDFGDGNGTSSLAPAHKYDSIGSFPVTLFGQNRCGTSVYSDTITILWGIDNVRNEEAISGYFNNGQLHITTHSRNLLNASFEVYDLGGRMLAQNQLNGNYSTMSIECVSSQILIVKLISELEPVCIKVPVIFN